jgi:hypothetical protein
MNRRWRLDRSRGESSSRISVGLLSFYEVVNEVASGRYPGPEDWLLATSVWIARCQWLHTGCD